MIEDLLKSRFDEYAPGNALEQEMFLYHAMILQRLTERFPKGG